MFQPFEVELPTFADYVYNIVDFGAVGDGVTSNTQAFRKAIEAAHTTGGQVLVPNGIWLTGPIELKSGVNLHLADNALILFDKNPEEYPVIVTDYEGIKRIRAVSPIHAYHAENIAITGNGRIDGNGHLWRPIKEWKMSARQWKELLEQSPYVLPSKEGGVWVPSETIFKCAGEGEVSPTEDNCLEKAAECYDYYRPVMVNFKYCDKVLIEGVSLRNSPAWNVHPFFCTNLTVRNATIFNPYHAQNGDGIDVESCKNVEIHHCNFQTGDDGICLKSGKDAEARQILGPCENIYVHDCIVGNSHGGFVVGSEMSRGVRNVLVEDCTFINADVGLRFKSAMGRGGVVEDIHIRRINMADIKEDALIMTMQYVLNTMGKDEDERKTGIDEDVPVFRNINIEDCNCIGAKRGIHISGMEWKTPTIYDISIKNFNVRAKESNILKVCENVTIL